MNWTKVGLKVVVYNIVLTDDSGLNWTKVGLKVSVVETGGQAPYRLNWTKVGLKAFYKCPHYHMQWV